jgi:hypothetical protein
VYTRRREREGRSKKQGKAHTYTKHRKSIRKTSIDIRVSHYKGRNTKKKRAVPSSLREKEGNAKWGGRQKNKQVTTTMKASSIGRVKGEREGGGEGGGGGGKQNPPSSHTLTH